MNQGQLDPENVRLIAKDSHRPLRTAGQHQHAEVNISLTEPDTPAVRSEDVLSSGPDPDQVTDGGNDDRLEAEVERLDVPARNWICRLLGRSRVRGR